ncbi:hypothetical protein EZV62_003547 [Acer yangbiense]|uniref:Ferritin n=1 Tax=Acer yangbiense TaxID=1000413 RepID=A0A5C7IIX2_9ROSI|nr:hypothetical protein EZV62_003547 [Acer yangbiense]
MWSNLERTRVYINTAPPPPYLQSPFFSASSKTKTRKEKMFSKTVSVSASSLTTKGGDTFKSAVDGSSFSKLKSLSFSQKTRSFKVSATSIEADNFALTGVVFQPFEELKKEYLAVPITAHVSMARQTYSDECEAAINEQIKWVVRFRYLVEYNASYLYHALFAYFDRDNVALKGLAKFFKESSEEEREHAEKLMEYQVLPILLGLPFDAEIL